MTIRVDYVKHSLIILNMFELFSIMKI